MQFYYGEFEPELCLRFFRYESQSTLSWSSYSKVEFLGVSEDLDDTESDIPCDAVFVLPEGINRK